MKKRNIIRALKNLKINFDFIEFGKLALLIKTNNLIKNKTIKNLFREIVKKNKHTLKQIEDENKILNLKFQFIENYNSKKRIIITNQQSKNKNILLSFAVRDLFLAHSDKYEINVDTAHKAIWDNNPYITNFPYNKIITPDQIFNYTDESGNEIDSIKCEYFMDNESYFFNYDVVLNFKEKLEKFLSIEIPFTDYKNDNYQMSLLDLISQPYCNTAETNCKKKLYLFGWPSYLGGADTKFTHLIKLLNDDYEIFVVPNFAEQTNQEYWVKYLTGYNAKPILFKDLPEKLEGIGLSLCNAFFLKNLCDNIKDRGLKIIFSSEMCWYNDGEINAIKNGLIDKLLYVSEIQKQKLNYESFTNIPTAITGNFIDSSDFPFLERDLNRFNIGRLSRPDPDKYPEDFPLFYDLIAPPRTRFRIMAWNEYLSKKYNWFKFDDRWDLLYANQETQQNFLNSIDIFVFILGHKFVESSGRSTVEAMLTGAIPIVQTGHHLENLINSGDTGFVIDDVNEYKNLLSKLEMDKDYRKELSHKCHKHAKYILCNRDEHLKIWREALSV